MKGCKMKCPFCNKKLEPIGTSGQFQCGTWGCDASFNFIATRDVWEYIARTRKALEIAIMGLKNCKTRDHIGAICRTPEYVDKILEQITAEQKD